MKQKKFEKVVELEEYDWQKKDLNFSHFMGFMFGIFFTLSLIGIFSDNFTAFLIATIGIIFFLIILFTKKRKVYWREIDS